MNEEIPLSKNEDSPKTKPAMVRLTHPHGFVEDDTGRLRYWKAGDVIKDPNEIDLLIERGAHVEFLD